MNLKEGGLYKSELSLSETAVSTENEFDVTI